MNKPTIEDVLKQIKAIYKEYIVHNELPEAYKEGMDTYNQKLAEHFLASLSTCEQCEGLKKRIEELEKERDDYKEGYNDVSIIRTRVVNERNLYRDAFEDKNLQITRLQQQCSEKDKEIERLKQYEPKQGCHDVAKYYDDEEDDGWQPCDNCDLPDACADFGCAIKAGIKREFHG